MFKGALAALVRDKLSLCSIISDRSLGARSFISFLCRDTGGVLGVLPLSEK